MCSDNMLRISRLRKLTGQGLVQCRCLCPLQGSTSLKISLHFQWDFRDSVPKDVVVTRHYSILKVYNRNLKMGNLGNTPEEEIQEKCFLRIYIISYYT